MVFVVRNVGIATAIAVTILSRVEFAMFATAYFLVQIRRCFMRLAYAPFFAACVLITGTGRADDTAKKDVDALQGNWVVVGRQVLGKKATRKELEEVPTYVVIEGNQGRAWMEDKGKKGDMSEGTIKIDPAAKPKAVDITYTRGLLKGWTVPAIYELDGDNLKVCFAWQTKDRPTEFAGDPDGKAILVIYKRDKK
jgi:uncharacterized protein (TIGR03067 family)